VGRGGAEWGEGECVCVWGIFRIAEFRGGRVRAPAEARGRFGGVFAISGTEVYVSVGHLFGALLLLLPNLCGGGGAPCAAGPALRPFLGRSIGRCPRQSMTRIVLEDPLAPGGRSEPVNDLVMMRCRDGMICR
jgi:hypothetical protein